MNFENVKYYIPIYRTLIFGFMLLLIGIGTSLMLFLGFNYELDFSYIFILPILVILSITSAYYGVKTIYNHKKFIQLELLDNQLKYLIVGTGRGAALNYYINPRFKIIDYKNIISVNIIKVNIFDTRIQILKKDNTKIELPFLYDNIIELEEVLKELKKRLK